MEKVFIDDYLPKPLINTKNLKYITETKDIYANLYEFELKNKISIYKYYLSIYPEVETENSTFRHKIYKSILEQDQLRNLYEPFFIFRDKLYSLKKEENEVSFNIKIKTRGFIGYTLTIGHYEVEIIKENDIQNNFIHKKVIELLIKDYLYKEQNKCVRDRYHLERLPNLINENYFSLKICQYFSINFMKIEKGNFLKIYPNYLILNKESILDYLYDLHYLNSSNHQRIKEHLIGKKFKTFPYYEENHIITDIIFDKKPKDFESNFFNRNFIGYFKQKQPILLSREKGKNIYFLPQLCYLLDFKQNKNIDINLLKIVYQLSPPQRINIINDVLNMFEKMNNSFMGYNYYNYLYDNPKKPNFFRIKEFKEPFKAYYIQKPKFLGKDNKIINDNDKSFPLIKKEMTSWICFYHIRNYDVADDFYKTMNKISKTYKIKIDEPEWIEMPEYSKEQDWLDTVDYYLNDENKYNYAVFLIDSNSNLYSKLKEHSFKNGYISQIIEKKSLNKLNINKVCLTVLLQINCKLGGNLYKIEIENEIKEQNLMIIGIDSSRVKKKRVGVAMVSTINDTFTNFISDYSPIDEKDFRKNLNLCISNFIKKMIEEYIKKNNKKPNGIIIYRKGLTLNQKNYLRVEKNQIEQICKENNLSYYYILVHTKQNCDIFVKENNSYDNPHLGLLAINEITNKDLFEFYLQSQQFRKTCAKSTCYQVIYGNLNIHEILPKFTFDLCHLYNHLGGAIRMPHVLKYAEKLLLSSQYFKGNLNPNFKYSLAYL